MGSRSRTACLALLMTLTAPAWATTPPSLTVPASVTADIDEYAIVRPKTDAVAVMYLPMSKGVRVQPPELLPPNSTVGVFSSRTPGTYKVRVVAASKDGGLATATFTVTFLGEQPTPPPPIPPVPPVPPDPGPGPTPPPVPPAKAWLVVIEETAEAKSNRGAYYSDPGLLGYLKGKGWKARIADKDAKDPAGNPPRDLAPYLRLAAGQSLPRAFVVDQAGTVRYAGALPATPAEMLAILRRIGG
jgi:hypothetical protein